MYMTDTGVLYQTNTKMYVFMWTSRYICGLYFNISKFEFSLDLNYLKYTICPESSDPFYTVYIL